MRKTEVEAKLGLDRLNEEVTQEELEEAGYQYKATDTKEYAVATAEVELPETMEEILNVVEKDDLVEMVQSRLKSSASKGAYDEMFSRLNKEVPKEVENLLDSMKEMATAGIAPYSVEDLADIPFEAKTSKTALMKYVAAELK